MKSKELEKLLAGELASITPDFDKILNEINSVSLPTSATYSPVAKSKKAKAEGKYENIWNRRATVAKRQPKMKIGAALLSLCMCTLLVVVSMFAFGMFAFDGDIVIGLDKRANTYVTLNINPEIELAVNKFNKITTATATNNSGKILLAQLYKELDVTTLVGQELNGALISIIDQAAKMGYIDVGAETLTNAIMIDVVGNNVAETNKNLLANEAKEYFVSKGIYAIVVTNYDSKQSLIEEAKKYNPNIDANTPIADLISTVEGNNGGKDIYEQEIERITADNAKYQEYLDNTMVSDVKIMLDKRISDLKDFISKENKIIANYQLILADYQVELDALNVKLAEAQSELDKANSEYDKLISQIDNKEEMVIAKNNLKTAEDKKCEVENQISKIINEIVVIEDDYNKKIAYLNNLIVEYDNKINQMQQQNADNQTELDIKAAEKKKYEKTLAQHNNDLTNITSLYDSLNSEVKELLTGIETLESNKFDADNNVNLGNMFNSYLTVVANIQKLMPSYNTTNIADNCMSCNSKKAIYNIIDYLITKNRVLYSLSVAEGDTLQSRLDSVILDAVKVVAESEYYYTTAQIGFNKQIDYNKFAADVKKVIWEEAEMQHHTFWDLLVNMTKACDAYKIDYGFESMVILSTFIDEDIVYYTNVSKLLAENIDNKTKDLTNKKLILQGMEIEKKSIEEKVLLLNNAIDDCNISMFRLQNQIYVNELEIVKINKEIDLANSDKIDAKLTFDQSHENLTDSIVYKNQQLTDLGALISQYQAVVDNILDKYADEIESKKSKLETVKSYKLHCENDVNTNIQRQNDVNLAIDRTINKIFGYNILVNDILNFANAYRLGARIELADEALSNDINLEIAAIEERINSKKDDSLFEMQENIRTNLSMQAEYQYSKNIDKYTQHNTTITKEQYTSWEEEQMLIVEEKGWQVIYNDWLASQK